MLKQTDNQLLTQVSRGTPMGELMRRYWHPVAEAGESPDAELIVATLATWNQALAPEPVAEPELAGAARFASF